MKQVGSLLTKPSRYCFYWQGKSKRVKVAVEAFLQSDKPVKEIAEKYHVSIGAISNNAKCLRYLNRVGAINLLEELATSTQQESSKEK